jgi:glycosyltransferase involved in cell wall biosynthesis
VKGHEKLIQAVAAVQNAGYNVQLDIVGNGPLRDSLEKQAASTLRHYKFWGGLPHKDILSLMRQSELFCHSSIETENGQTEAFGLVVTEAQWAGLPVVAFKSGGVPEAMSDGESGILCPEGDIKSMKDAICKLIDDRDLYNRMSLAAPDFIRGKFDNYNQTENLQTIYDTVYKKCQGADRK